MQFNFGVENNVEGRSQAWALGHPGCFVYGKDSAAALAAVPQAVLDYQHWILQHTPESWLPSEPAEVNLEETWAVYTIDSAFDLASEGYEVNAWFRHDWKPLTEVDIQRGLKLLAWSRADLLQVAGGLGAAELATRSPGERWDIAGILRHVGGAEWWYLDRLGLAFPRQQLPQEPFERLQAVRHRLEEILPSLAGSSQVTGVDGEFWSPRKLLRRAVWHERDHTEHILKLL